jgi:transcription termination/antitermination protein NusG
MLQTANGFEGTVERTIMMAVQAQRLHDQIEQARRFCPHAMCRVLRTLESVRASHFCAYAQVFLPILEGETSVRESSVMPSYIFVRMRMNQELHFLISSLQYVVSFVGADRGGRTMSGQMQGNRGFVRPLPMTDEQFQNIVQLTKQSVSSKDGAAEAGFAVDEVLEVLEGPFKGLQGPVLAVGEDGETLTVALQVWCTFQTTAAIPRVLTHCTRRNLPGQVMGRDTPVDVPSRHVEKVAV